MNQRLRCNILFWAAVCLFFLVMYDNSLEWWIPSNLHHMSTFLINHSSLSDLVDNITSKRYCRLTCSKISSCEARSSGIRRKKNETTNHHAYCFIFIAFFPLLQEWKKNRTRKHVQTSRFRTTLWNMLNDFERFTAFLLHRIRAMAAHGHLLISRYLSHSSFSPFFLSYVCVFIFSFISFSSYLWAHTYTQPIHWHRWMVVDRCTICNNLSWSNKYKRCG